MMIIIIFVVVQFSTFSQEMARTKISINEKRVEKYIYNKSLDD
jgi:hypothetical protein